MTGRLAIAACALAIQIAAAPSVAAGPSPSIDPELLDYLVQDVCLDGASRPTADDPATCARRRDIAVGEPSPYIVTDHDRGTGMTYSAMTSVPVRAPDGGLRVIVTKSMQSNFGPGFRFDFKAARDGYDLIDTEHGGFVSFIRTSDGGCFDQIFSRSPSIRSAADRAGGWIIFPRTAPSIWPQTSKTTVITYKVQLTKGVVNCRDSHATGVTYWNAPTTYMFESGKRLTAIRSDHFSLADQAKSGNGLERFYFTREYGFTRWEAWIPEAKCRKQNGAEAAACRSIRDGNPLAVRCSTLNATSSGDAGVDFWGGQKWIRVDCRDQTNFIALTRPQILISDGMAQADGVNDLSLGR